jgi:hypothetical protein
VAEVVPPAFLSVKRKNAGTAAAQLTRVRGMDLLSWLLLAQDAERKFLRDERTLWYTAMICGVLLVGAVILQWAQRWRKRQMTDDRPVNQLTSFRDLYEEGELTRAEYERIRSSVAERVRDEPTPTPPIQPAPKEPPTPQSPE